MRDIDIYIDMCVGTQSKCKMHKTIETELSY